MVEVHGYLASLILLNMFLIELKYFSLCSFQSEGTSLGFKATIRVLSSGCVCGIGVQAAYNHTDTTAL